MINLHGVGSPTQDLPCVLLALELIGLSLHSELFKTIMPTSQAGSYCSIAVNRPVSFLPTARLKQYYLLSIEYSTVVYLCSSIPSEYANEKGPDTTKSNPLSLSYKLLQLAFDKKAR